MRIKKLTAFALVVSSVICPLLIGVASAQNGNGIELAVYDEGVEDVSFCDKYPLLCVVLMSGNGSGNEPPAK